MRRVFVGFQHILERASTAFPHSCAERLGMKREAPPSERSNFDEPLPEDIPVANLPENARIVLAKRYLKKDSEGTPIEEPEVMFWRVAKVIANIDLEYGASEGVVEELARQFYDLMTAGVFEPNSPTLMNAGRPLGQLSACFVLPVDDALSNGKSGIYDTLKAMALVHQSGGGRASPFHDFGRPVRRSNRRWVSRPDRSRL